MEVEFFRIDEERRLLIVSFPGLYTRKKYGKQIGRQELREAAAVHCPGRSETRYDGWIYNVLHDITGNTQRQRETFWMNGKRGS